MTLMIILGVTSTIVFGLLHVRYFVLLGFLMGLFNIIPIVGAVITVTLACIVAALDTWTKMFGVLIFFSSTRTSKTPFSSPASCATASTSWASQYSSHSSLAPPSPASSEPSSQSPRLPLSPSSSKSTLFAPMPPPPLKSIQFNRHFSRRLTNDKSPSNFGSQPQLLIFLKDPNPCYSQPCV